MHKFSDYLQESSLSRIWGKTQKHTCGTITGYRDEITKAQVKKNNNEIVNYLQGKGYSVTKIQGNYIENFGSDSAKEVSEPSYFVCNHKVDGDDKGQLEKDLFKLGQRFDQDSILMIPFGGKNAYLYGTSKRENAYPPLKKKVVVGKSGKYGKVAGQFLSRIRGREFAFEEVEAPGTINGKRGQQILVNEIDNT